MVDLKDHRFENVSEPSDDEPGREQDRDYFGEQELQERHWYRRSSSVSFIFSIKTNPGFSIIVNVDARLCEHTSPEEWRSICDICLDRTYQDRRGPEVDRARYEDRPLM